jgi:ATP-dependent RNA helicase DHX8/PRP22
MDFIKQLQYNSLVNQLVTQLDNHLGLKDKELAEFIISLAEEATGLDEFKESIVATGAELGDQLVETLWNLIKKLDPNRLAAAMSSKGAGTSSQPAPPSMPKESTLPAVVQPTKYEFSHIDNDLKQIFVLSARDLTPSGGRQGIFFADKIQKFPCSASMPSCANADPFFGCIYRNDAEPDSDNPKKRRREEDDEDSFRLGVQRSPSPGRERENDRDRDRNRDDDRARGRDSYGRDTGRQDDRGRRDSHRERSRSRDRDQYDRRRRSRSRSPRRSGRDDAGPLDDDPVSHKIYDGIVSNIKDFGAFVTLKGVRGKRDGLVHISEIRQGARVNNPAEVLKLRQTVKVKVKAVSGGKISLSMKEVDQETGRDLNPLPDHDPRFPVRRPDAPPGPARGDTFGMDDISNPLRPGSTAASRRERLLDGVDLFAIENGPRRPTRRPTSPERFEYAQLVAAGVIPLEERPDFDVDVGGIVAQVEEDNEDWDIELNEEEPVFLRGHIAHAGALSPVKIVKNPEGSLQRAAVAQSALSKERRELREQQRRELLDAIPQDDLLQPWEDPMAKTGDRMLAADLRGQFTPQEEDVPEWKKGALSAKLGRVTTLTIKEQRESLPMFKLRDALLDAVAQNQILVVVGETGSGKTTQITQYMIENGYGKRGRVGCTQPRRVAATSVAKRVAEEFGCRLGEEVGYSIRFEDLTSPQTLIKYMTDGMLLRECLVDPDLKQYSVIILDEAHERNVHTDVLMGLMKQTTIRRPDLKLIVTSATLDADKFSKYFRDCPIFTIPGRMFPVDILYTKDPEADYLDAALITVMQIHLSEPPGDILVFLTGQEEIDTACQILFDRMKALGSGVPELIILPIYSALPSEMQSRIFEPAPKGARKVILGTNIAETSVTIDGIYYVVDPGFVKQKVYNPKTGMDALVVCPISKAQAKQRAGRAGRTGPGKCYRLYTETAYQHEMLDSPIPEIQRINLATTVLHLKALGINDLLTFDFMDRPSESQLVAAMHNLYTLGALDDEGLLTRVGRKMAEFPLEPPLSKMLLTSAELGCSDEILTVVAMISVQNIFYRPKEKQALADQKKAKFHQVEGDHLTLLAVYEAWKAAKFSNPWCYENFIQARSMRRAQDVRKQILQLMDRYKLDVVTCGRNYNKVRMAIVSGFFSHAAKKDPQEGYKTLVEGTPVYIHPSSALFQRNPDYVIYHELVQTTKEYMREVTSVEPKWLVEFAPKFFKSSDPNKLSKRKRRERIEPLFNKYAQNQNEWRMSKRRG